MEYLDAKLSEIQIKWRNYLVYYTLLSYNDTNSPIQWAESKVQHLKKKGDKAAHILARYAKQIEGMDAKRWLNKTI